MKNTTIVEDQVTETAEELQATIAELNKKLEVTEEKEANDSRVLSDYPVANILLKLTPSTVVPMNNVTPAEVLLLSAMHHKGAKGNPISKIEPQGTIKAEPISYRAALCDKYGAPIVMALFPGSEPNFPKTFSRAMSMGISTSIPSKNLMDFHVTPLNSGS